MLIELLLLVVVPKERGEEKKPWKSCHHFVQGKKRDQADVMNR